VKLVSTLSYILILLLIILCFLFPVAFVIWTSLRSHGAIVSGLIFSTDYTLEHYYNVFFMPGYAFTKAFTNSLIVSTISTILTVMISFPAAYSIARFRTGGGTLSSSILLVRLLPPMVFAIPISVLFQVVNMRDNLISLILVYTAFNAPLDIFVLKSFIDEIPIELEEAAIVDGCSRLQLIRHVTLPISMPGIIATAILTFVACWSEYPFALLLSIRHAVTINVVAAQFVTQAVVKYGEIAAAVALGMIPTVLFMMLVQKHLVKGLTLGAVKG